MIKEHEIPSGSRLYFGQSAKFKRQIETTASTIFYEAGFEEILTPFFSYHAHQALDNDQTLIHLADGENEPVVLRADSSLDVVRLITRRLGRAVDHNRWFYVQPVFRYPTTEIYQIGAEVIGSSDVQIIIDLALSIIKAVEQKPVLELSNVKISRLMIEQEGIDPAWIKNGNIGALRQSGQDWIKALMSVHTIDDAYRVADICPQAIADELRHLASTAQDMDYCDYVLYPLHYADMCYYDDIVFRLIDGNSVIATGGHYLNGNDSAVGFALYTDHIVENLLKGEL